MESSLFSAKVSEGSHGSYTPESAEKEELSDILTVLILRIFPFPTFNGQNLGRYPRIILYYTMSYSTFEFGTDSAL